MSLWDENAPLDALFTSISLYNWTIHSGIELRIVDVDDKIAPLGEFVDGVFFIHAQDIVDVNVTAFHRDYDIPAHNLPFSTFYRIDLIGNLNSSTMVNSLNSDGSSKVRIVFDSALTSSDVIDFILAERAITLTTVGTGTITPDKLASSVKSAVIWQSSIKTSSFTASSNEGYWVDTSSNTVTITFPSVQV